MVTIEKDREKLIDAGYTFERYKCNRDLLNENYVAHLREAMSRATPSAGERQLILKAFGDMKICAQTVRWTKSITGRLRSICWTGRSQK